MPRNINLLTAQELFSQDTDGYLPVLLEVHNPDIKWENGYEQENGYLRLISDVNKVKYKGKTWLPCAFDYTPPEKDGAKIGNASITISAIDARVRILLRTIRLKSEISIVAVFAKVKRDEISENISYKFVPLENVKFSMKSATSNSSSATFTLEVDSSLKQSIPYDIATQDRCPAVSNG